MPLVLEIEYLLGVAFAARGPDSADPDWPPQPDRVFSALVAAWAARGAAPEERAALEWLEGQSPPKIEASDAVARPAPTSYVPPNDKLQRTANPAWRTRQPRRFPAALPHDPVVRLVWPDVDEPPLAALDAVGRDVAYLGHSASLTRCAFRIEDGERHVVGRQAQRRIYAGRLQELERAFAAGRRPLAGATVIPPRPGEPASPGAFSADWLTFEIVGDGLDLRATALACKALIKTVMSGYEIASGRDAIPAWVSGHEADGAPTKEPHLAAVPLAFAGFGHSDGALMGLALVPPRGRSDLLANAGFRKALLAVSRQHEDDRRRVSLTCGRDGALDLALTLAAERASLDPHRYAQAARRWGTVTPVVLDRHLKGASAEDVQLEVEAMIAEACERSVGSRPIRVAAGKHSAVLGAPSAYPSGGAPRWTGWRIPDHFASRRLVHAVIDFGTAVQGPLLIGAGRFCGLGLCLPLDVEHAA